MLVEDPISKNYIVLHKHTVHFYFMITKKSWGSLHKDCAGANSIESSVDSTWRQTSRVACETKDNN
jgi:hypothetical protein